MHTHHLNPYTVTAAEELALRDLADQLDPGPLRDALYGFTARLRDGAGVTLRETDDDAAILGDLLEDAS